jgi:hypothetical protein
MQEKIIHNLINLTAYVALKSTVINKTRRQKQMTFYKTVALSIMLYGSET